MDTMQIGPAGGNGGKPFDHYNIPNGARLSAVHVYCEWVINALQFEFTDDAPGSRPPVGSSSGEHHVFTLDEDEYLIRRRIHRDVREELVRAGLGS